MIEIVSSTREFAKKVFEGDNSGHDMEHTENVVKNALEICDIEGRGDREIVEIAALLHDVDDWKFLEKRQQSGGETVVDWLKNLDCSESVIGEVKEIIDGVSFYGPRSTDKTVSFEGDVVRDADRLEAMGERGVERARMFARARGIPEFNEHMPDLDLTDSEYRNHMRKGNTFVNHFFEKLLFLKNKLKTVGGKQLGEEKHQYMKNYLRDYLGEMKTKFPERLEQIDNLLEMLDSSKYD